MATTKKITATNVAVTCAAGIALGFVAAHFGELVRTSELAFPSNYVDAANGTLAHLLAAPFDVNPLNGSVFGAMVFGFGLPWLWWWWMLANQGNYRPGEEHGSARWATKEETREFGDWKDPDNNVILSKNARMVFSPKGFNLERDRNKNVLILGGPGSGKTRYVIKPNLMQLNSSVWVSDPKGTILPEVGHLFEDAGYEIRTLNTLDFKKSMHFNPFAYIREQKDIPQLVQCIVQNVKPKDAGKASDPFWEQTEKQLLVALVGYMCEALPAEQRTFRTLNRLISMIEISEDGRNDTPSPIDILFSAWETGTMPDMRPKKTPYGRGRDEEPKEIKNKDLIRCGEPHPDSYAVREYTKFKTGAGKTLKSVLMSVHSDLWQFDLEDVLNLTDFDEMDLDHIGGYADEDIEAAAEADPDVLDPGDGTVCGRTKNHPNGQRKVAMFVIMDDQDSTYGFLIATLTWLGISRLKSYADAHGGKLPIPVQFYLDEFANIGKIADFQQVITTIRSRGMATTLVLQSLAQLDSLYGKDEAGIIKDACDSWVYLGGSGVDTCEVLSKKLGNETVNNRNMSKTYAQQRSSSASEQILQRPLMDLAEISKMPRKKCLVMITGTNAFLDDKYLIEDHPRYSKIDPGHKAGKRPGLGGKKWPAAEYDDEFDVRELTGRHAAKHLRVARKPMLTDEEALRMQEELDLGLGKSLLDVRSNVEIEEFTSTVWSGETWE